MSGALVRGAVAIFLAGALAACSTNGPAVTGPETSSVALDMRGPPHLRKGERRLCCA